MTHRRFSDLPRDVTRLPSVGDQGPDGKVAITIAAGNDHDDVRVAVSVAQHATTASG